MGVTVTARKEFCSFCLVKVELATLRHTVPTSISAPLSLAPIQHASPRAEAEARQSLQLLVLAPFDSSMAPPRMVGRAASPAREEDLLRLRAFPASAAQRS